MFYEVYVGSKYYHGLVPLTYAADVILEPGRVVRIPLRNRTSLGIVKSQVKKPSFKCSAILDLIDATIPPPQLRLIEWLLGYYPAPMGSIIDLFLPKLPKRLTEVSPVISKLSEPTISLSPPLTSDQISAMDEINAAGQPVILHGKTGSGKTRVYQELALQILKSGKSTIVLAPEIGLSKHLEDRFREILPSETVHVIHSNMTDKNRREIWLRIHQSSQPLVVIGARSALFVPLKDIGLVVLDEFHDTAYKQEQLPNYQTSRVAAQLAKESNAQVIFGSATPPLADYIAFQQKNLPIVRMASSALESQAKDTEHIIVDLADTQQFSQSSHLSNVLITSIQDSLAQNQQSLIFLNRRGSARVVACETCGWRSTCQDCDVGHTYHGDKQRLICHSCGLQQPLPASCPECGGSDLIYTIAGTKTLEQEITKLFPHARIHRLDRDTTPENKIERTLKSLESGKIDIIIGTQSVVKGFDLKNLSTVGVIYADASLQIADYTATERTFQLISQVAGRLGRGHTDGRLILQTYDPASKLIQWALNNDYTAMLNAEKKNRERYHYPPYRYLMKITAKRSTQKAAQEALTTLCERLPRHKDIDISNPSPSYPERVAGKHRWQILVKAQKRTYLVQIAKQLPNNYSFDLDPNTLL